MSQNTNIFTFAPTSLLLSQAGLEISQYEDMSGVQTQNTQSWIETPTVRQARVLLFVEAEHAQDARFGLLTENNYEEECDSSERVDSMSPTPSCLLPEQGVYYPF